MYIINMFAPRTCSTASRNGLTITCNWKLTRVVLSNFLKKKQNEYTRRDLIRTVAPLVGEGGFIIEEGFHKYYNNIRRSFSARSRLSSLLFPR